MNVSMNDIPSVMTRKEAQEILKVSKNTILELLQNGYLSSFTIKGRYRITDTCIKNRGKIRHITLFSLLFKLYPIFRNLSGMYTYIYYFKALAILPNASLLVSSNKLV